MAKVKNLEIKRQSNSTTYYATWKFDGKKETTASTSIKAGSLVSIKSGATYYNGVTIPDWVKGQKWYVSHISGDRAVLGKNQSGSNNINSPVNTKYLTTGSSTSSSTVSTNTLDHYEVKWFYSTGNGTWFNLSEDTNVKDTHSICGKIPDNAITIKVNVKPVAKNKDKKENGKDVPHWEGSTVSEKFNVKEQGLPETPPNPSVEIDKFKLTASVVLDLSNEANARTDQIYFQVYDDTKLIKKGYADVKLGQASFTWTVPAGGQYKVRCRAINLYGDDKIYSLDYSGWSEEKTTIPKAPSKITKCKADSETSVYLEWSKVSTATSYEIEYTTDKKYFDGSDQTSKVSSIETTNYIKTGLDSGEEYFFRVRAVNEQGESSWTDIKSVIIGEAPAAPTTWSSSTTAIAGEEVTLYWVHNSEDGSSQTYAELELVVDGKKTTKTIENSTAEDEKDKTSSYKLDTLLYPSASKIKWRVRTKGITDKYGDWSTQRTIDVHAQPTLELAMTDADGKETETLNSFPFFISAKAGPDNQTPIGYHVVITARYSYETVDNIGNTKKVKKNEEVYSKYFDTKKDLLIQLTPSSIDLVNGEYYRITCTVSMNSGLTETESWDFSVDWDEVEYEPEAGITVDTDTYVAYIRPYCLDADGKRISNVTLSVYRREFDGSFVEIATGLKNSKNTTVTDPHPALDYARYRIVATDDTTGAVSYYDPPGYPVNGKAVIIQWDEEWSEFDVETEDALVDAPWTGSFLSLPYNIDVSDSSSPDVAHIAYIGRQHPVSYYGTQRGETATWNVTIPKEDKDTLYALRRLKAWMGNAYVREPSGSGYWASVKVSFNQKHRDLTIPVTLDITRVEGGI